MQPHTIKTKQPAWRGFLALIALLSLGACLPDSDSVREKRLQDFSSGEAASFATALSSYSTQSHGALLRNAAFLNGTLNQGELGRSLDGVLANGYCHEGGGADTNHMLLAWYTQTDRDGEFTVKGIGKGAGAGIVQALSTHAAPQMIGYYGSREIRLRGPRRNGETELAIPAGCDLDIPAGAPVLVLEHISPADQVGLAGGSYEYRTVSCEDVNDIGARTERRQIRTQDDGTVSRGTWEMYDTTCDGAVSTRAVSIERSIGNLIGALDLTDAGSLQGALNGLAGLDCVKVKTGEIQTDAEGNEIEEGEEIADTCDTKNIDVTKYETDKDMARTDEVRSREQLSVSCGRGQTGTLPRGQHDASYQGYTGSLNLHTGWSGAATYERFTFNAKQQSGGQSSVDGLQKGLWQGHELNCTRLETMTVDCYDVFPEYRSLSPVKLGGMSVQRVNRIFGWATKSPPNANNPLAGSVGWYQAGASCEWIENGTYGCCGDLGEGWSQTSTGRKERDVKGTSIKSSSRSQWRDLGAAQCRKPYDYYWDDCTTTCTGTGEERECTESCVTRHEIRYHRASTDLYMCEGIEPPQNCQATGTCPPQTCEQRGDCPEKGGQCDGSQEVCNLFTNRVLGNYMALFGRTPDAEGALYWTKFHMDIAGAAGKSLNDPDILAQLDYAMLQAGIMNGEQIKSNTGGFSDIRVPEGLMFNPEVISIYHEVFGRDADGPGALYWTNQLHALSHQGVSEAERIAKIKELMRISGIKNGEALDLPAYTGGTKLTNVDAIEPWIIEVYTDGLGRMPSNEQGGLLYWQQNYQELGGQWIRDEDLTPEQVKERTKELMYHSAVHNNEYIATDFYSDVVEGGQVRTYIDSFYNDTLGRDIAIQQNGKTYLEGGAYYWNDNHDRLVQEYTQSGMSAAQANAKAEEDVKKAMRASAIHNGETLRD